MPYPEHERGPLHVASAERGPRYMKDSLFIERSPGGNWLVKRYTNEDRGAEVVSLHRTEQEAEAAIRKALFPPPPKEEW